MTFKAIVGIVLGAMLANNYALEKFLGAAPLLGWSTQEKKTTVLGVSVTVAMLLTALIAGLVYLTEYIGVVCRPTFWTRCPLAICRRSSLPRSFSSLSMR